jgi:nucleotide-binding universal stress UspA family protein
MKKKIIVPTDITPAAAKALQQAAIFARKTESSITLLHVIDKNSASEEDVKRVLDRVAEGVMERSGVQCEVMIREGNLFEVISYVACEKDYDLMVIGTHGIRGVKQLFFGADIIKLIVRIPFPVWVVQEESPLVSSIGKIVLAVSSHDIFHSAINAILHFAKLYPLEVHLYSIYRAGFPWSEQLIRNIEEATSQFKANNVSLVRVKEDQTLYSLGYAKQTVKYAKSINADAFCMITIPTEESHYFAQTDKETLLFNDFYIPVLCVGGGNANKVSPWQ